MTKALFTIVAFIAVGLVGAASAVADEAPIAGTVKAIDASANTFDAPDYSEGQHPRRDDPAKAGLEDREVRAGDGAGEERVRRAATDPQQPQAGLGGERHHQA